MIRRSWFSAISVMLILAILSVACSSRKQPANTIAIPAATPEGVTQWPTREWPTSTPAEQGFEDQKLAQMQDHIRSAGLTLDSLLIIRHGYLVSETYYRGYTQSTRHVLYSCTKSFVSTLAGIAIDQGLIEGVKGKVLDFFPDKSFEDVDEWKSSMTLEDLLTMTSGLGWVEGDTNYSALYLSKDPIKYMLDLPMVNGPGRFFNYCSGCSHVIAGIVQEKSGQNLLAYAQRNLLDPLGFTNYSWDTDRNGNPFGGWGLNVTPRDMAKLGFLFLHDGSWEGKQIVSAAWVKEATSKHVERDNGNGYGYQWWTYSNGAYAALGMYGQTIYVLPSLDLLVVVTADMPNHDQIFPLIDDYIIPAATH